VGSKLGWILAVSLAVLVVAGLVIGLGISHLSTTPPTPATTRGHILAMKTITVPIEEVVASRPAAAGNAADDYALALRALQADFSAIAQASGAIQKATAGSPIALPAGRLERLRRVYQPVAAGARKAEFAWPIAPFEIEYDYAPALQLQQLHGAVHALGEYYRKTGDLDRAEKVFRADMILGWHMTGDRGRACMVSSGLGVQMDALAALKRLYKQQGSRPAMIEAITRYDDQRSDMSIAYRQKAEIIWTAHPHPGDVFNIIANDEDRAWRTEGLLSLAILKFTQQEVPGNARHIRNLLARHAAGDDPYLAQAATTAIETTIDDLADKGILIQ
jgi:hypothetical protein